MQGRPFLFAGHPDVGVIEKSLPLPHENSFSIKARSSLNFKVHGRGTVGYGRRGSLLFCHY